MIFIIQYLFLFVFGSILGWILEVFYRRFFGLARHWINPGFLSGPFLPIYGSGICVLYFISTLPLSIYYKFLLFILITTCLEYVTGLFFLTYFKIRLWDYSKLKINIQGIISLLYSFIWGLLSLFFYFVIFPFLNSYIQFIYTHLEYSLIIGVFIGMIFVDMNHSFNIVSRLKKFVESVEDLNLVINYEQLKEDIREQFEVFSSRLEKFEESIEDRIDLKLNSKVRQILKRRQKPSFMLPFRGESQLNYRLHALVNNARQKRQP